MLSRRWCWGLACALLMLFCLPATARADCAAVLASLSRDTVDVQCTSSPDLTTANPNTIPADNSRADLPQYAFTPRTDAAAVAPDPPHRTAITKVVPGLQVTGGMKDDRNARWVLRLPNAWNGRIVVGVPGGFRSEYTSDYIVSDYVIQRGYAYVSTNKGILNFYASNPVTDPLACRLSPPPAATSGLYFHFYLNDAGDTIREWFQRTREATALARLAASAHYRRGAERAYLFGISNGGHVVRRLLADAPDEYDGGVDWEGVYWSSLGPNILIDLPSALRRWPEYRDSGLSPASAGHQAMLDAGYPPDIFASPPTPSNTYSPLLGSFWETHLNNYWDVTTCAFVQEIDPGYDGAPEDYDYGSRRLAFGLNKALTGIVTTGWIDKPLLTVHGTMDALLPIERHARPFRQRVIAAGRAELHRLYEVQNGNHIERFKQSSYNFTELEFLQPHAHRAFSLLVNWVEKGVEPPPGQCIPRGGAIVSNPSAQRRPEHCPALLVP